MSENTELATSGHEGHSIALAHPDTARAGTVGILIAMLAIVLAITSYMLWVYFEREAEAITYQVVYSKESEALKSLRAMEASELSGAAVLDQDEGTYRIPVNHGAALFIKEAQERRMQNIPQRIEALPLATAEGTEAEEVVIP